MDPRLRRPRRDHRRSTATSAKYKAKSTFNDLHPLYRAFSKYKGKTWGFFDDGDVWILYYRKDIFANAKLKSRLQGEVQRRRCACHRRWHEFNETAQFITDQMAPKVYGTASARGARQPGQLVLLLPAVPLERRQFFDPKTMKALINNADRRARRCSRSSR